VTEGHRAFVRPYRRPGGISLRGGFFKSALSVTYNGYPVALYQRLLIDCTHSALRRRPPGL